MIRPCKLPAGGRGVLLLGVDAACLAGPLEAQQFEPQAIAAAVDRHLPGSFEL
ncbi:MAG: hypothetical protein ACR2HZ_09115 [Gemmatimonadaceae bacterium]